MRQVFLEILKASNRQKTPVVLHNGLLDLLFIYRAFYAELPDKLGVFIADLSEMFVSGLFDTKYVSDYVTRERISYLAYLFRKYQREQRRRSLSKGLPYFTQEIRPALRLDPKIMKANILPVKSGNICENYAFHGFCKFGNDCANSHDLDAILDAEEKREAKRNKKKRKTEELEEDKFKDFAQMAGNENPTSVQQQLHQQKQQQVQEKLNVDTHDAHDFHHTAYFDAFMTAFVFGHQVLEYERGAFTVNDESESDTESGDGQESSQWRKEWYNKIYLINKEIPLIIDKSRFINCSSEHQRKKASYK